MNGSSERLLFGGAITAHIPSQWNDLSDIREVPDHQEIFQDSFHKENPFMLVIEILERQGHVSDEDAASFFFRELAEQNDALQSNSDIHFENGVAPTAVSILNDPSVSKGRNSVSFLAGSGYQQVAIGRDFDDAGNSRRDKQELKSIQVDLCVIRLPVQETDLVISISKPVGDSNFDQTSYKASSESSAILNHVISTICIRNWGLFG